MAGMRNDSKISSAQKAAVLLAMVGEETAAEALRGLTDQEAQMVAAELAKMESISPEVVECVLETIAPLLSEDEVNGGPRFANRLLTTAFGQGNAISHRLFGPDGKRNDSEALNAGDPVQIATMLGSEHPQTAAVLISQLASKQASDVLLSMNAVNRGEIVRRMATMGHPSPERVLAITKSLSSRLTVAAHGGKSGHAGYKMVAEIMNRFDSESATSLLAEIEGQDAEIATGIRELMFTFDDFQTLPPQVLREILGNVDKNSLAMALKGAKDGLKQLFYSTMSSRAADMLKEDMEVLGRVRAKDVTKAQQEIVAVARKLEAEGKIMLRNDADGEDGYVQ